MPSHNERTELESLKINGGRAFSWWAGVPTASVAGYIPGSLAVDYTNAFLYINTGTLASATWTKVGTQS